MTDAHRDERVVADAARARVEALRQRRTARRHPAGRSRVGVAAFSVATMLGLVGVMGLTRPAPSVPPTATADDAAPPVALTARPRVQVTNLVAATPVARTNGSH